MGRANNFGCFGSLLRFLLITINSIFLILGLTVFITAAVIRWSSVLDKFTKIEGIETLIKVGTIGSVSIVLLCLGAFIILLSIFGLIGVSRANKFFLIVYEVIVVLLFLAHAIALLVLVFSSGSIEKGYKKEMAKTVEIINDNGTDSKFRCELMKSISTIFKCCGNEAGDILPSKRQDCCQIEKDTDSLPGCTSTSTDWIKSQAVNFMIIPSAVILAIELFTIIVVPFMMGRAGRE